MTLWSVDVCVTSMKIVDGKNRFKPFKEMLLAMKAIINQNENAKLATVIEKDENQTAIGIDEHRFSNNHSKNNFKFQNESIPSPEDLKRSVQNVGVKYVNSMKICNMKICKFILTTSFANG